MEIPKHHQESFNLSCEEKELFLVYFLKNQQNLLLKDFHFSAMENANLENLLRDLLYLKTKDMSQQQ